jgi:hypothetical protein
MNKEELVKLFDDLKTAHELPNDNSGEYNMGYVDAMRMAMNQVNNCSIPDVVKSLPTDKCVEQWWAEGQDQNKGFWKEAPYRTNGDVVEEIKTALKYFITVWQ